MSSSYKRKRNAKNAANSSSSAAQNNVALDSSEGELNTSDWKRSKSLSTNNNNNGNSYNNFENEDNLIDPESSNQDPQSKGNDELENEEQQMDYGRGGKALAEYDDGSINPDNLDSDEKNVIKGQVLQRLDKIKDSYKSMKSKFVKEQLGLIQIELDSLNTGDHPEFLARLEENEQSKISQLKVLENTFEFLCKSVLNHHDCFIVTAENTFQRDKEALKLEMLQNLTHRLMKLKREFKSLGPSLAMKLFIERMDYDEATSSVRVIRQDIKGIMEQQFLKVELEPNELEYDLKLMQEGILPFHRKQTGSTNVPNTSTEVDPSVNNKVVPLQSSASTNAIDAKDISFQNGKLVISSNVFERDQQISVEDQSLGKYNGHITAINSSEVWVKRSDGTRTKLYISQIRLGKYRISPLVL